MSRSVTGRGSKPVLLLQIETILEAAARYRARSADEFVLIGALWRDFAATMVRLQRRNALNARKDPHGKPVG